MPNGNSEDETWMTSHEYEGNVFETIGPREMCEARLTELAAEGIDGKLEQL